MKTHYFDKIGKISYKGPDSDNPLAFHFYDKNRIVLGKTMEQHLRFAVCYWHNFCWSGSDIFGMETFNRTWHKSGDAMEKAREKADAAFELISKLDVPFYCFHDTDIAPEASNLKDTLENVRRMAD